MPIGLHAKEGLNNEPFVQTLPLWPCFWTICVAMYLNFRFKVPSGSFINRQKRLKKPSNYRDGSNWAHYALNLIIFPFLACFASGSLSFSWVIKIYASCWLPYLNVNLTIITSFVGNSQNSYNVCMKPVVSSWDLAVNVVHIMKKQVFTKQVWSLVQMKSHILLFNNLTQFIRHRYLKARKSDFSRSKKQSPADTVLCKR